MSTLEEASTKIIAASGAFAGGISVFLYQGIDMIKSHMQRLEATKNKSNMYCFTEILKNEGPFAFYKVSLILLHINSARIIEQNISLEN